MNYLDKAMVDMRHIGIFDLKGKTPAEIFSFKLVATYENGYELELTLPNTPLPNGERYTTKWECKEVKGGCVTDSNTGKTVCSK